MITLCLSLLAFYWPWDDAGNVSLAFRGALCSRTLMEKPNGLNLDIVPSLSHAELSDEVPIKHQLSASWKLSSKWVIDQQCRLAR